MKIIIKNIIYALDTFLSYIIYVIKNILVLSKKANNVTVNEIKIKGNKSFISQSVTIINCDKEDTVNRINKVRIFNNLPEYNLYSNVIYFPVKNKWAIKFSGLYTEDGDLINNSCIYRGGGGDNLLKVTALPAHIDTNCNVVKKSSEDYIFIGPIVNHYGHFLTECVSRLWYFVRNDISNTYLLYHGRKDVLTTPYILNFFELLGIDIKRLIRFDEVTRLSSVIIPSPSMMNISSIHSVHKITMEYIASKIIKNNNNESSQPIYLSRENLNYCSRRIFGENSLRKILEEKNIKIVYPEKLSLVQQISLFNCHKIIIGPLGSAHHNTLFSLNPRKHIYISGWADNNYLMIDAIKQNESIFICSSDKISFIKKGANQNVSIKNDLILQELANLGIL